MIEHLYKISIFAIGPQEYIDITEEDYYEIKESHQFVSLGLALEEKLDLLVENYVELEKELLDMAIQYSIFSGSIETLLTESRHRVNRRLVNLLTAIRLYHDQIAHALSTRYGKDSNQFKGFKKFANTQYDSQLSYRAIEAIRNHIQHASLPITAIDFPMKRIESDTKKSNSEIPIKIECKITPYIGIKRLEENPKFKKQVLNELRNIANKKNNVELIPLVRQYIVCIGHIHNNLRSLCCADLDAAKNTILKFRDRAKSKTEGLSAIQYTPDNTYSDYVSLTERAINRWQDLHRKNNNFDRAAVTFVSSE
jgi:hypothetical protein